MSQGLGQKMASHSQVDELDLHEAEQPQLVGWLALPGCFLFFFGQQNMQDSWLEPSDPWLHVTSWVSWKIAVGRALSIDGSASL